MITGIDISSFRDGEKDLADLLLAVKDAPCRIRLGSLEVNVVTPRLLDAAKSVRDFAPHFHLSLQSGSDGVLKKMNRHYTAEEYLQKVQLIRSYFPDAAVTTDVITGFPTEDGGAVCAETCAFVRKVGFFADPLFFVQRRRYDAQSRELPRNKKRRLHEMLAIAGSCARKYETKFLGKVLELVRREKRWSTTTVFQN